MANLTGVVAGPSGFLNGVQVYAWIADSRFPSMPKAGDNPPAGVADYGPVITSSDFGGPGQWEILNVTDNQPYYIQVVYPVGSISAKSYWSYDDSLIVHTGAQGPTGPQGNPGSAATVAVGTTTTGAAGTSASVTNSGTSSAAVLNFTVPQGATGPQGPAGTGASNATTTATGSVQLAGDLGGTGTTATAPTIAATTNVNNIISANTTVAGAVQKSGSTMTGELVVPDIKITGLTGATASSSRLVGTTSAGPPASGTFAVGDMVIDQTATIWFCTTAGTPGTWINVVPNSLVVRSATATAGTGEFTIFGTTGTSGQTITLPATAVNGSIYQIKNLSPYTVNILGGTNSISISGTSYGASTPYTIPLNAAYTFVYSGGVWFCFTTTDINKMGGLPLATSGGGTGLSTIGTVGQVLTVNSGATALQYSNPTVVPTNRTGSNTVNANEYTVQTGTGGGTAVVTLPTSPATGTANTVVNNTTGNIAVQRGGTNTLTLIQGTSTTTGQTSVTLVGGEVVVFTYSGGVWYYNQSGITGTGNQVLATAPAINNPNFSGTQQAIFSYGLNAYNNSATPITIDDGASGYLLNLNWVGGSNNQSINFPTSTTTSDTITTNAIAATLTNKTISGANNTITNVPLTTGVSGTLPTGNGGTNLTTFTAANNAIYSTSASALTAGTLPVLAGGTGNTTGQPSGTAGGDLTGSYPNPTLAAAGTAGTYGSATAVPIVTTDSKGRVTSVTTAAPSDTTKVPLSTVTTAGDLIVGTGSSTVSRLGLGTAGQIPTVNPAGTALTYLVTPQQAIQLGIAETMPRWSASSATISFATSGNIVGSPVYLVAGQVVSNINFSTGTTAGSTLTGNWAAILTSSGTVVALTAQQGLSAMAATTVFTWPIATTVSGSTGTSSSTWTVPTTGIYYIGICVTGTTTPSMVGVSIASSALTAKTPITAFRQTGSLNPPSSFPTSYTLSSVANAYHLYLT